MTDVRLSKPIAENGVAAGEPEKLALPARAVERLVRLGLRTEPGMAWWDGFACAHGDPSWLVAGRFRLVAEGGALLPGPPPGEEG
jgi:hypothetical protein